MPEMEQEKIVMIGIEMGIPTSCEYCNFCTSDGECMAMGGDSLWEFLPKSEEYFPNGWKCKECPLIDLSLYEDDLK